MGTKGERNARLRRAIRAAEKNRESLPRGKMMGRVSRRNYGGNGPVDGGRLNRDEYE